MSLKQGDADFAADRSAFRAAIYDTLDDKRIISYFDRGLVSRDQVDKLLANGDLFDQARHINSYRVYRNMQNQAIPRASRASVSKAMQNWLDDSIEEVIIPNTILAINTILGNDSDKLLVEQDSEGLRRGASF
jgi:hypothetical protein